jgi:serine/threonine protein kinase
MLSLTGAPGGQTLRCPACSTSFRLAPTVGGSEPLAGTVGPSIAPTDPAPPLAPTAPPPGQPATIGPFQVRGELGRGAFGVVYHGLDPDLGRDVAIKVLKPEALGSAQHIERFLREAKVVGKMLHGNIVPVHQLGQHEGAYFIASAFIKGQPLSRAIPEGGLPLEEAVRLTLQLLDALAYAHQRGVLHRDVKPHNAMLGEDGTLYLMDFGLAGWVGQEEGRLTQDGAVLGTPAYMPPEQAAGQLKEVGPASDQYSAGVVLYELLTGHLPFEGPLQAVLYQAIHTPPPKPSTFRPEIDDRLERICLKALSKKPEDRFPDCKAFADILRTWQPGGSKILPGSKPPGAPPARRVAPSPRQKPAGQQSTVTPPLLAATVAEEAFDPPLLEPAPTGLSRRGWLLLAAGLAIPILAGAGVVIVKALQSKEKPRGPGIKEIQEEETR